MPSNTLQKTSLFWDVKDIDPRQHARFIIERILAFGDQDDFNWAMNFYGKKEIKECFLKSKILDKKSTSFWCQYFNINQSKCIPNQLIRKQNMFWKR